jgi:hypothetical protein
MKGANTITGKNQDKIKIKNVLMWPIKHAKNHIMLSYELKSKVGPSLQDDPLDIVIEISDSERDFDIQCCYKR